MNFPQSNEPLPSLGRMMVFVDGENLVARYQEMKKEGWTPKESVVHDPNVFVWGPGTIQPGLNIIIRATYYTYAVGSAEVILEKSEKIKALRFNQRPSSQSFHVMNELVNTMYPKVFQKIKNKQAKGVDIQMTVDILANVYQNNLDTVYLISGDGDFQPVIEEAIRYGKQVYVAALSSGLNEKLKHIADRFIDIDNRYFLEKPKE